MPFSLQFIIFQIRFKRRCNAHCNLRLFKLVSKGDAIFPAFFGTIHCNLYFLTAIYNFSSLVHRSMPCGFLSQFSSSPRFEGWCKISIRFSTARCNDIAIGIIRNRFEIIVANIVLESGNRRRNWTGRGGCRIHPTSRKAEDRAPSAGGAIFSPSDRAIVNFA